MSSDKGIHSNQRNSTESTQAAVKQELKQLVLSMHGQLAAGSLGEIIWSSDSQDQCILEIPSEFVLLPIPFHQR